LGFAGVRDDEAESHRRIEDELKKTFRPEFINRIDEIIIFESLTKQDVVEIVDMQMKEISARLAEHGLRIQLTQPAKEWLAEQGYDEDFGARPLKRALQRHVESPLSVQLLKGEFEQGDHILIDERDGELTFERLEPAEPPQRVEEEISAVNED
jgi:ATP-dependent Clp protease ATP-binding subunit ClpC